MKITSLKAQLKNPDRISIFVDGVYSFSLSINEVLEHKLVKNMDLSESDVTVYKKISSDGKVRARTYEWLLIRPRSTKELQEYLYKKKVDKTLSGKLESEFVKSGILSNDRFTEWSVERLTRKNKSIRAITNELKSKGISEETIHNVVSRESTSDKEMLKKLIDKVGSRPRYSDQKKLIAYLLTKGFHYTDIKEVLAITEP